MGGGRAKVYPSREVAEERFRLFPPQPCANRYILIYIARHSLMRVDGGWAWKFDEELPLTLKGGERQPEDYSGLTLPVGIVYGELSESCKKNLGGLYRGADSGRGARRGSRGCAAPCLLGPAASFCRRLARVGCGTLNVEECATETW